MKILSIETSCDDTGIALLDCRGPVSNPKFKILAEALNSQTKIHEKYGGVYPNMARNEHQKNLTPLLLKVVRASGIKHQASGKIKINKIKKILEKEPVILKDFLEKIIKIPKPQIDAIAVTHGPGIEPCLWAGINFAKALSCLWSIPVYGINHMEGHIFSVLLNQTKSQKLKAKSLIQFPLLSLLVSGGHTQLVFSKKHFKYEIVGKTRDDAIGEAFDKVARTLGLPYPGGPHISALAEKARKLGDRVPKFVLPRPMIHSKDLDFSFSGIKTSVLYLTQKIGKLTPKIREQIALEFENAVTEVLIHKTRLAIEKYKVKTLIVSGGVSANKHIRRELEKIGAVFPSPKLSTDNAVMIGIAGYLRIKSKKTNAPKKAIGNLAL